MKIKYLKSFAFSSLILAIAAIGCGKSSGGSPQPEGGDYFVGTWNDIEGNVLTISIENDLIAPGYDHKVKYITSNLIINEPCKLSDSTTLTCVPFGSKKGDLLVYNSTDSTILFTTEFPTKKTITFYKP